MGKTGAQKRKQGEDAEDSGSKTNKSEKDNDDDPDRWVKLRLDGEKKPKKIDATRIVSYYDFDNRTKTHQDVLDSLQDGVDADASAAPVSEASLDTGFRARLRNLFEADEDDGD